MEMLLKESSYMKAVCYCCAAALLRAARWSGAGRSSTWGYGTYPWAERRQKCEPKLMRTCSAAVP